MKPGIRCVGRGAGTEVGFPHWCREPVSELDRESASTPCSASTTFTDRRQLFLPVRYPSRPKPLGNSTASSTDRSRSQTCLSNSRGRGPGERFRQSVPPLPVLFLQLQKRLHRVVPLLWSRSPVRWPTVPGPGFAGLPPLPVTCLPLRVRQCHKGSPTPLRNGPGKRSVDSVREVNAPSAARAFLWSGSPEWVLSRTSGLVMPGRGTLARRNRPGWAGRRGRRRTRKGVPSSDNPSVAEGSFGARGDRGDGPVVVVAPSEPGGGALARADHVRMGVDARPRANPPLRKRRNNWRSAADTSGTPAEPPVRRCLGLHTGFRKQRVGGAAATADRVAVHDVLAVVTLAATGPFDSSVRRTQAPPSGVPGGRSLRL